MALLHHISTLLYCFNREEKILLLRRNRKPNAGFWSPCGGKLDVASGESPHACACREAREEIGLDLSPRDLHLTGLVSEEGYEGSGHWLMFLFEVLPRLHSLPPDHGEGTFRFFSRAELNEIELPVTDLEQIWPLFWKHRGGFFAAHCQCRPPEPNHWTIEESIESKMKTP